MPPANNDFASAQVIAGLRGWQPFSNVGATVEAGEPSAHRGNGFTVWFKWTCPSAAPDGYTAVFDTGASPYPPLFDSIIAVYQAGTPDTLANLVFIDFDDDSDLQSGAPGSFGTSQVTFQADAGATYYIRVGGWNPFATDATAILRWAALPSTVGPWVQETDQIVNTAHFGPAGFLFGTYQSIADTPTHAFDGFHSATFGFGVKLSALDPGTALTGLLYTTGFDSNNPTMYEVYLHLMTDAQFVIWALDDYVASYPGSYAALEFEDNGSFAGQPIRGALIGDVSYVLSLNADIYNDGLHDAPFPGDLALELKELTAGMWNTEPTADPHSTGNPTLDLTTANLVLAGDGSGPNPWLKPEDVSGLTTFASLSPGAGATLTTSFTLPVGENRAFWFGPSHFLSREDASGFRYGIDLASSFTYRPRRHRFIFASSPTLPTGPLPPPVLAALPDSAFTAEVRAEARLVPGIRMDGG